MYEDSVAGGSVSGNALDGNATTWLENVNGSNPQSTSAGAEDTSSSRRHSMEVLDCCDDHNSQIEIAVAAAHEARAETYVFEASLLCKRLPPNDQEYPTYLVTIIADAFAWLCEEEGPTAPLLQGAIVSPANSRIPGSDGNDSWRQLRLPNSTGSTVLPMARPMLLRIGLA